MDKWRPVVHSNRMEMDGQMALASAVTALRITPSLLSLVAEIDEFKGAWRAIGRIAPDRLTSLRRVATIESIGSSTRIEGARLSNFEVEKLLSNLRLRSFASRDEQEVAGYADVMETVFEHWADIPIDENHIRQLHRDLLAHSSKDERHRGTYKTVPNHVEAFDEYGKGLGVVFATASPLATPQLMGELLAWRQARESDKALHPLLVIAVFVVVFLEIHPFQDGNGRLSRVLTTLLLLRAGYSYVPYSSLESIVEQSKEAYYLALRRTQGTIRSAEPNWEPWLDFFLRALRQQKVHLESKIEREIFIFGDLPELSTQILTLARERGRVTIADAVKVTGQSRHTIKDHVKTLVNRGLLALHGAGRGAWYGLG
jgi:Fic family protein